MQTRNIRRLKYIEAFTAVMRTGSISGAARQMGMSQPAVSQLIANFEEALGAPLFVRRNGAIYPTSRAETLLDDALDLLSLIDRMEMRMALKTDRPLSHLRISATLSFISEVLPRVIAEMRAAEPELSCSVASHAVDEMTQAVAEGQIDFAFHTRPLEHPGIVNIRQSDQPQVCIMRADHPLAEKTRLEVADLGGNAFIMPSRRDPYYRYYRELFARHRVNYTVALQAPFARFAIEMAGVLNALSFNSALMAALACERNPALTWRPIEGLDARTSYYLSYPALMEGTPSQTLIRDCFARVLDRVHPGLSPR